MQGSSEDGKGLLLLVFVLLSGLVGIFGSHGGAGCPTSEWQLKDDVCYYISPPDGDSFNFKAAVNVCLSHNSTITSILDENESDFLGKIIQTNTYWIGLVTVDDYNDNELVLEKRREGWRWLDGSQYNYRSTWSNWYNGSDDEASEPKEEKNCAIMYYQEDGWTWRGANCLYDKYPVICKKTLPQLHTVTATVTVGFTRLSSTSDPGMKSPERESIAAIIGGVCAAVLLLLVIVVAAFLVRRRNINKSPEAEPPECPYYDFARISPVVPRTGAAGQQAKTANIVEQIVALSKKNKTTATQREPSYYNVARVGREYQTQPAGGLYISRPATESSTDDVTSSADFVITPYAETGFMIQCDVESPRNSNPYDNAGFVNGRPPRSTPGPQSGATVLYAKPLKVNKLIADQDDS